MERTPRAVLTGADTARLLALAGELEARGLEVALYREPARGLEACASGRCDVLVAIGRLAPHDGEPAQRVAVPLVLLDAPDAPDLPLRPTGPRTALGPTVLPSAAADRVLALLARGPGAPAVARVQEPATARPEAAPPTAPQRTETPKSPLPARSEARPGASAGVGEPTPDAPSGRATSSPGAPAGSAPAGAPVNEEPAPGTADYHPKTTLQERRETAEPPGEAAEPHLEPAESEVPSQHPGQRRGRVPFGLLVWIAGMALGLALGVLVLVLTGVVR